MATRIIKTIVDDIDGTVASECVEITINDKVSYRLDLSEQNFEQFLAAMNRWTEHATPIRVKPGKSARVGKDGEPAKIRAWARSRGIEVQERGRVPQEIVEQYRAAQEPRALDLVS